MNKEVSKSERSKGDSMKRKVPDFATFVETVSRRLKNGRTGMLISATCHSRKNRKEK